MFRIMLLVATVGLMELQLRLITSVTLAKASDYCGDHDFPCFIVHLQDFDSCLTLCYRLQVVWHKSRRSSAGPRGLGIHVMEKMCNCLNIQF